MSDPQKGGPGAGILPHGIRRNRSWGRQVAGPLMLGLAVWCAAGTVAPLSADSASARLAVPAPWWVVVVATAVAALVPALRQHPVLATPALLSTLPWWPLPLVPVAWTFTGPLAWLPIGLSGLAAVATMTSAARGRAVGAAPWLAAAVTLAAAALTAWSVAPRVPSGDEPHYLVLTQSLLLDGDLRIQNNHDRADYRAYHPGPLPPHTLARGRDGAVYSVHAPGTAVVVLPAFALAGYPGARLTVLLLAGLTGMLIWKIGRLAAGTETAAWVALAAVAGSATFLLLGGMIFPDGIGALGVAGGVWLVARLLSGAATPAWTITAAATGLALLPWLHTRFAVLAGALGVTVLWTILRSPSPAPHKRRQALQFVTVPMLSAIGWFAFFALVYGTPNPVAPYGTAAENSWRYIPSGVVAILFDAQYGLLMYTPVLAAAFFGTRDRLSRICLLIALVYLAGVATYWMWWAGVPALPARFATAALPLLAPGVAVTWQRASPAGRWLWLGWLAISLAITAVTVGVDRGALAWNVRDAQPGWLEWLGPVVNLPRALPSFFWSLQVVDGQPQFSSIVPFVLHAVAAIVAVVGVCSTAVWLARRRETIQGRAAVVAWGIGISLMVVAHAGWWLRGTNGLDPSAAQVAVLTATGGDRSAFSIGPGRIASTQRLADLRVSPPESGVYRSAGWGIVPGLPAGRYELRFFMRTPTSAVVHARIGRGQVLATCPLAPLSQQACTVEVPASGVLVLESDKEPRQFGGRVEITRQ